MQPDLVARVYQSAKRFWWVALIGLALLLAATQFKEPRLLHLFVEHLAIAFLVAYIITSSIDYFFTAELAADVLRASLRFVIPKEVVGEMLEMAKTWVICIDHRHEIHLDRIGPDRVRVRIELERVLRNEGSVPVMVNPRLGVDNWLLEQDTFRLEAFGFQPEGGEVHDLSGRKQIRDIGWKFEPPAPVRLDPQKTLRSWSIIEETLHAVDLHTTEFGYATKNPRVTVRCHESLGYEIGAGHRLPMKPGGKPHSWELNGLMLPHQAIHIKWFDKQRNAEWRRANTPEAPPVDA